MRWILLIILVLSVLGLVLISSSAEVDSVANLQGHRMGGIVAGGACVAVIFVLVVGAFLTLSR